MNTLSALLDNNGRFQMMAARYLQESRSGVTGNINERGHHNSTPGRDIDGDIPELPMVTIPDAQINYLHIYAETGIPALNLVQGIRAIPAERQAAIISQIINVINFAAGESSLIAVSTSQSLTRAHTMADKIAPIAIVPVQLSWEALKIIRSWWKGEITGKRCAKQIIVSSAGILGGYGGGAAGTDIGSAFWLGYGPLAGAAIGGIVGSIGASALAKRLTEYFFDLPIDASAGILDGYCDGAAGDAIGSAFGPGYGGGAAGAAIGSAFGPGYGPLAGAVIGGIVGSIGASALAEWLTKYFFDLPKSIAVENAYKFLQLSPSCSITEINGRYRKLVLQFHPDKGGNADDFHKLQVSVAIIKLARGQEV